MKTTHKLSKLIENFSFGSYCFPSITIDNNLMKVYFFTKSFYNRFRSDIALLRSFIAEIN